MEAKFGPDQIYEFLKLLVTTGDTHYIEPDHTIWRKSNGTPVGVNLHKGKDGSRQIALYKENMTMGNFVLLNPFNDNIGFSPEKDWFFMWLQVLPGCLIREAMQSMTARALSKDDDTGFKGAAVMAKFIDRIDQKFATELEKIRAVDIAIIYYAKDQHIAQLNSALWEEEYESMVLKSKLRKSSLMLIRDMVSTMLGTDKPEELLYTATLLGCPQFDAEFHVFVDVIERISKIYEPMTGKDLHVKELKEHGSHLEAYHKAMQWLASYTAAPKQEKEKENVSVSEALKSPWEQQANPDLQNGQTVVSVAAATGAASGTTVSNPNFPDAATPKPNNGLVVNPTFGAGMMPTSVPEVTPSGEATVSSVMAAGGGVVVPAPPPPMSPTMFGMPVGCCASVPSAPMSPMGMMAGAGMGMGMPMGGGYGGGMGVVANPTLMRPPGTFGLM